MTFDAIVVGAGFAGLAASVRLTAAGLRVLVLEARPHAGGRAFSYRHAATGERVDNGQHLLAGCYHETRAFLRAIGAESNLRLQDSLDVTMIDSGGHSTLLSCPMLPSPWHLLGALVEWEALDWADRMSAFRIAGPLRTARSEAKGATALRAASPDETVAQWLGRNGQSERLRLMLWEPLALAALNQPAGQAAAPAFTAVLGRMFGDDRDDSALAWPIVPLSDFYVEPAVTWLTERGSAVRTSTRAVVRVAGGRVEGVACGQERLSSGVVVVAVPWHALPSTIVGGTGAIDDVLARAARTAASPIVTVSLWLDRPVLQRPFVGLPGRRFQWVFDRSQLVGSGGSHLSLVSSGADDLEGRRRGELVAIALSELCDAVPEARRARVVHGSAVRERRATFSLAPGQPARPGAGTGVDGLVLAGDWIETGLPGTIEGAVASGHRAAGITLR